MGANQDLTLLILAGGRSLRMGSDKPALPFPSSLDPPLIHQVHRRLCPLAAACLVAGPSSFGLHCCTVEDLPGLPGPLGGLVAGLLAAPTELVLAVATDLPLVEPRLAQQLVVWARAATAAKAVVCQCNGRLEPLFAVYRRSAAQRLRQAGAATLDARGPSLQAALAAVDSKTVPEHSWRPFDPDGSSFQGCNTPEELAAAGLRSIRGNPGGEK
ncbi:MAG: molybdenum cofactor guanylyltransferase [Candidatus Dormibacteria bacterium]